MAKKAKISNALEELLKEKAQRSPCTYRISGIAFSKKGNILGYCTNSHSKWQILEKNPIGRAGTPWLLVFDFVWHPSLVKNSLIPQMSGTPIIQCE